MRVVPELHVEVDGRQLKKHGEIVFGDVYLSKRIEKEDRTVIVMSDGLGSGIKANVLATLTSSMALKFIEGDVEIRRTAETIMKTLPVCSVRKISYSTFTIIDIQHDGHVRIYEYDNPETIILRNGSPLDLKREELQVKSELTGMRTIRYCDFMLEKEDRIVTVSDGVTQAGMGSSEYPFGWGETDFSSYVCELVGNDPYISAGDLAFSVVEKSSRINGYAPKDDSTCVSVYMREPRNLLICTGPPFDEKNDMVLARTVERFRGRKVICGGTTAQIVARELGRELTVDMFSAGPDMPPVSKMEGADLVTEGILTLGRMCELLKAHENDENEGVEDSPAGAVMREILNSDKIEFLVGTRVNNAHQDPSLPVELEIRRNVVKRVAAVIERKYMKKVHVRYI